MKYALLINELPGVFEALPSDEQGAISAEYFAIRSDPRVVDGGHLAPAHTASTVRLKDGDALVTDGPFADTKEVLGGYYLLEADARTRVPGGLPRRCRPRRGSHPGGLRDRGREVAH